MENDKKRFVRMNITLEEGTVSSLKARSEESGIPMSRIISTALKAPTNVSPENIVSSLNGTFTEQQYAMLKQFEEKTGLSREKILEDMFGTYYETLFHEDRPTVPRVTSTLSPEKQKDLDELRGTMKDLTTSTAIKNPADKFARDMLEHGATVSYTPDPHFRFDPMEKTPLGGMGVFDQKTGEMITDPEELEARKYSDE